MLVEHQCPRCGAPVTLEDTDRLFQCGFCRVRLYVLPKKYLRYYLRTKTPAPEETVYAPYWRFRGMSLALRPYEIKSRMLDMNFRALAQGFLPESLGLRAQALRLGFAEPGMDGRFLLPDMPLENALSRAEKTSHFMDAFSASGMPMEVALASAEGFSRAIDSFAPSGGVIHSAFIGEAVSMLYAPFFIKGRAIYDAVLMKPVAGCSAGRKDTIEASADSRSDWGIAFAPALCPACGWDLEGGRTSVALFCKNCDRGFGVSGAGQLVEIPFAAASPGEKDARYFPFWRMRASVSGPGLKADSLADLARLANLPRAVRPEWEKKEAYFWAPAFRTAPRLFLRLSKQMTVLDAPEHSTGTLPRGGLCPVTLGVEEASQALTSIIANLAVPRKKYFPAIPEMEVKLADWLLVYLPFSAKGYDYVQPDMKFSIQRNALREEP